MFREFGTLPRDPGLSDIFCQVHTSVCRVSKLIGSWVFVYIFWSFFGWCRVFCDGFGTSEREPRKEVGKGPKDIPCSCFIFCGQNSNFEKVQDLWTAAWLKIGTIVVVLSQHISLKYFFERIKSLQCYELPRRCNPLPLMQASPYMYLGLDIVNSHWCRNSNGFSTIFNLGIWMVLKSLVDTCSLDHNLDKLLSGCTIKLWRSIGITKPNPITARELPKILRRTGNISETNWCQLALQTRPERATLNLLILGQNLGRVLSFSGITFSSGICHEPNVLHVMFFRTV